MTLKIKSFLFYVLFASFLSTAQKRPKLVIGVVIDQMRYDYLTRFYNKFGDGGFKKLMTQGHHLENVYYNYIPTYTAVGHASIYTGATPENHGIISNSWYDKYQKKYAYCVNDARYKTIGSKNGGKKSPHRLQTAGIMDQLHLAQNGKGKTIGLSIKDRSAILPAGHTANAAYWFKGGKEGNFISSSFYMQKLPKWVEKFNQKKIVKKYVNQSWNTLYPITTYKESREDDAPYEGLFDGEEKPVFPHPIKTLKDKNGHYSIVKNTPFGNDLLLDFAKATIIGENLGQDNNTDFLSVSFSSTDYIGHQYGPYSKEIEDTYLRLDRNIADLMVFLDKKVGKNNYTLFLTSDHGVVPVPSYLKTLKIPSGYFSKKAFKKFVKKKVLEKFGSDDLIEDISNFQIFLNKEVIKKQHLKSEEIQDFLVAEIIHFDKVYKAIGAYHLQNNDFNNGLLSSLQRGYNQKISGDILFILTPGVLAEGSQKGTSHGTAYSYDAHIPLLFYGYGIRKGITKKRYYITDITPTLSNVLQITPPSGSIGNIIVEALKE